MQYQKLTLQTEYVLPYQDLIVEQEGIQIWFWVVIGVIGAATILGILGVVVEYTRIGNVKHSHEETNFANIDIPMIQEGGGKT